MIPVVLLYDRAKKLSKCRLHRSFLPLSERSMRACSFETLAMLHHVKEVRLTDEMVPRGQRSEDMPAIEGF